MKSQPGFAKIICLDGRITGVLARGKSGQLSEFQKTFVKGSHAILIENREIWSKSVFSKIHQNTKDFFPQTKDHEEMQYAPKKIFKKRKERKKPSWLREGVRAHLAFASKLLVAHGNPLSPQRRGKTLANLITSLVGFQID